MDLMYNDILLLFPKFMDNKSLLFLSSVNTKFYKLYSKLRERAIDKIVIFNKLYCQNDKYSIDKFGQHKIQFKKSLRVIMHKNMPTKMFSDNYFVMNNLTMLILNGYHYSDKKYKTLLMVCLNLNYIQITDRAIVTGGPLWYIRFNKPKHSIDLVLIIKMPKLKYIMTSGVKTFVSQKSVKKIAFMDFNKTDISMFPNIKYIMVYENDFVYFSEKIPSIEYILINIIRENKTNVTYIIQKWVSIFPNIKELHIIGPFYYRINYEIIGNIKIYEHNYKNTDRNDNMSYYGTKLRKKFFSCIY